MGSPIGDADFCHQFISHKQSEAQNLLSKLADVGLVDPQVALTLLHMCCGFCRLSRTTPPSLSGAAVQLYDQDVCRCFSSCTAVDTSDAAWRQAFLGLSKGSSLIIPTCTWSVCSLYLLSWVWFRDKSSPLFCSCRF